MSAFTSLLLSRDQFVQHLLILSLLGPWDLKTSLQPSYQFLIYAPQLAGTDSVYFFASIASATVEETSSLLG